VKRLRIAAACLTHMGISRWYLLLWPLSALLARFGVWVSFGPGLRIRAGRTIP
jgi:hypothetical protein